jgi:hypothetical protein
MKPGKASGEDSISVELLQNGTMGMLEILTTIIQHAWIYNDIPETWTTSLLFPISKVSNPKTVADYRMIALCSIGYKLYAKYLYENIEQFLTPIPAYQAGFIKGRSTADQLFVLRRFLEERWNEGKSSIDLLNCAKSTNEFQGFPYIFFPWISRELLIQCG